jgi:hypothetical protein
MSDGGQYAQQSFLRGADVAVRVALECDVVFFATNRRSCVATGALP